MPDTYKSDEVLDIIAYVRTILARVDTSLIDEWSVEKFEHSFAPFYESYQEIIADPRARSPQLTQVKKLSDTSYSVVHTLLDDQEDNSWHIRAEIDLAVQREESAPFLNVIEISG